MEILENALEWQKTYHEKVLEPYQKTGAFEFKNYKYVKNSAAPGGQRVALEHARLIFISSSGAYLPDVQEPFDAGNDLGDYTVRQIPTNTPLDKLGYAHEHYDHTYVNQDPEVLIPLRFLRQLEEAGELGGLAPTWISFMGYQPDAYRVAHETTPKIIEIAREQNATAALLVPA